jgi:predicted nucleic acid-binding protein
VTVTDALAFDASVLVRSAVDPTGEAARLVGAVDRLEVDGHTTSLAFAESANALLKYVRAGGMTVADAGDALASLQRVPFLVHGHELAGPALHKAVELGLSAYDGTYAALAESTGSVLVTADRRLAAAVGNATLVV